MKLGDLRDKTVVNDAEAAKLLGVDPRYLPALENTELDRCTVGTLRGYVKALGGKIEVWTPQPTNGGGTRTLL